MNIQPFFQQKLVRCHKAITTLCWAKKNAALLLHNIVCNHRLSRLRSRGPNVNSLWIDFCTEQQAFKRLKDRCLLLWRQKNTLPVVRDTRSTVIQSSWGLMSNAFQLSSLDLYKNVWNRTCFLYYFSSYYFSHLVYIHHHHHIMPPNNL